MPMVRWMGRVNRWPTESRCWTSIEHKYWRRRVNSEEQWTGNLHKTLSCSSVIAHLIFGYLTSRCLPHTSIFHLQPISIIFQSFCQRQWTDARHYKTRAHAHSFWGNKELIWFPMSELPLFHCSFISRREIYQNVSILFSVFILLSCVSRSFGSHQETRWFPFAIVRNREWENERKPTSNQTTQQIIHDNLTIIIIVCLAFTRDANTRFFSIVTAEAAAAID